MRGINVIGNSGCDIDIIEKQAGTYFVRKSTSDLSYTKRLKKQAEKQISFYEKNSYEFITTPRVLNKVESEGEFYFDMEYFGSVDCITFLEKCCMADIDFLLEVLIAIICENIKNSKNADLDLDIFHEKYQRVNEQIIASPYINEKLIDYDKIEKTFQGMRSTKIPVGVCHGDLTLSNILVKPTENKFALIDFLDSFIESPLHDIVKVRQDTKYMWSLHFYHRTYDKNRIGSIFQYLDEQIDQFFTKFGFYNEYYKSFQVLNFLRILPYCNNVPIANMLINNINNIEQ